MKTRQTSTTVSRSMNIKSGLRAGITPIPIPLVLRPGVFVSLDSGSFIRAEGGGGLDHAVSGL